VLRRLRLWLFYRWLQSTRPEVYRRLSRLQWYRFWEMIIGIPPWETPFFNKMLREPSEHVLHLWRIAQKEEQES